MEGKLKEIIIKTFIECAKEEMEESGVKVLLFDEPLIEYTPGNFCSGYFEDDDENDRVTFACATARPQEAWFHVFVHEFCHFQQWRDRRDWWDGLKFDGYEGLELAIEAWNGEREASLTEIIQWCMASAEAEIDCERRVLEKIGKYKLPIDPKMYAKKANSYVAYYYAMPELRGWCNGERPYEVKEIMDMMPDHMDLTDRDYWSIAAKAMDLYRARCLQ